MVRGLESRGPLGALQRRSSGGCQLCSQLSGEGVLGPNTGLRLGPWASSASDSKGL